MQYASLILSILAALAVIYLLWLKPWRAECEDNLRLAKRFAEDGDIGLAQRIDALPKPVHIAAPEQPKEKAKLPTIPEWRANRKKIAENA